jgi:hypothetical protein
MRKTFVGFSTAENTPAHPCPLPVRTDLGSGSITPVKRTEISSAPLIPAVQSTLVVTACSSSESTSGGDFFGDGRDAAEQHMRTVCPPVPLAGTSPASFQNSREVNPNEEPSGNRHKDCRTISQLPKYLT